MRRSVASSMVIVPEGMGGSRFQKVCDISGDRSLEFARLCVEAFELLIEDFEALHEVLIVNVLACGDPSVTPGIERPILCLNLLERSCAAQSGHVSVF